MTRSVYGPRWILTAYLAVYSAAIVAGVLATHNLAGAAIHVALLIVGALALRTILPVVTDVKDSRL